MAISLKSRSNLFNLCASSRGIRTLNYDEPALDFYVLQVFYPVTVEFNGSAMEVCLAMSHMFLIFFLLPPAEEGGISPFLQFAVAPMLSVPSMTVKPSGSA